MSIKSELMHIQQADPDNILRPQEVVTWAAENQDSDLHRSLEWDDAKAAHAHRLQQVRQLIVIHVVSNDREPLVVSLSMDRKADGGYRSISDVAVRPDLRDIMLDDALAELDRVKAKHARVEELVGVWREANAVKERTASRRVRRGARETATA